MRSKQVKKFNSELTIYYDGEAIKAYDGETVASAIINSDRKIGRYTQSCNKRSVFCGMGVCFDCLAIIEDVGAVRTCMTKVSDGMRINSWAKSGLMEIDKLPTLCNDPKSFLEHKKCQVAIVGAGIGGLEAAIKCREKGLDVWIIDERPAPGGQYYKQPSPAILKSDLNPWTLEGKELIQKARDLGCKILSGALVWRANKIGDDIELSIFYGGEAFYLCPEHLVIATGAYDEPYPMPGWTLPGVMTVGGIQSLITSYGTVPKSPIVLCGNGPLLLQVASEIIDSGAKVSAVVSASGTPFSLLPHYFGTLWNNPELTIQGAKYLAKLIKNKVPLITNHIAVSVLGDEEASGVVIAPVDVYGKADLSQQREIKAETVGIGYGFTPSTELARQLGCEHTVSEDEKFNLFAKRNMCGESSISNVYIVGDCGSINASKVAKAQGKLAGISILEQMNIEHGFDVEKVDAVKQYEKNMRFQEHVNKIFYARPDFLSFCDDNTYICRCEEVTIGKLKKIIEDGVHDLGAIKRLTRIGMGRCQGRYCLQNVAKVLELMTGKKIAADKYIIPQAPLKPIPIAALTVEKPEWGGHKHSSLRELSADTRPNTFLGEEEIIIIGAGVAGCSTAYFLAKEGKNALVIDRGPVNGQASGGNAGSMHVQLLSFDFGKKAEKGGDPALKTLLLQKESAQIWATLEKEFNADFEIKTVGGLMMAENLEHVSFLEDKSSRERSVGIDVHVINQQELKDMLPLVSDHMVAAAFCPEEGKINPLKATQGVYLEAKKLGQRFKTNIDVTSIIKEKDGSFRINTSSGYFKTKIIVNCAGAWASQISGMVDKAIPVYGAPLQLVVTEALEQSVPYLLAHADRHLTMKQMKNGNFIIGGGWTATYNEVTKHPTSLRDSLEGNLWVAKRVIPSLAGVQFIRSWGAMNINIDGAPIVGEMPNVKNFYNTVTSNGYTLGPIMGRITTDLIVHGKTNWDISDFTLSRF